MSRRPSLDARRRGPHILIELSRIDEESAPGPFAYATALAEALPPLLPAGTVTVHGPGWRRGDAEPAPDAVLRLDGGGPPRGVHSVVAVPDVAHLLARRGLGLAGWARRNWSVSWASRQASVLIAPSRFVADSLERYLRVPAARLALVPPGLPGWFQRAPRKGTAALRAELGIPDRYFLIAGRALPSRNLDLLLRVWAAAESRLGAGVGLVVAGMQPPRRAPAGVVGIGRIPRGRMPALLSGAVAFLHAGLHEGSALSVIEAMACGTPPIVGASGALPEVVAGAGLVLDLGEETAWTAALILLATQPEVRSGFAGRCRELAVAFSAEASARALAPHLLPRPERGPGAVT
ncbi:MAG: glycosyltransferase [Candidatus Dormibacteraceae bacterium]